VYNEYYFGIVLVSQPYTTSHFTLGTPVKQYDMYAKVLFRSQATGPLFSKYLPWKNSTIAICLKKGQVSLGASEEAEQGTI